MKHRDFVIGQSFWCAGREWRCTDIGTRVITVIRLDGNVAVYSCPDSPEEQYEISSSHEQAESQGWFYGPPYVVAELVFDEYDMQGCTRKCKSVRYAKR